MLHILWLILKFILIVFGILLGVLVLALLLFLFCPVRYQAEGSGDYKEWKKAKASVRVSWLFHGICLGLCLEDGKISHSIRLFGIPFSRGGTRKKKKKEVPSKTKTSSKPSNKDTVSRNSQAVPMMERAPEEEKDLREPDYQKSKATPKPEEIPETQKKQGIFLRIRNKVSVFWDKLKKIPETIRDFLSNLQKIYDTIDYWKEFFAHPRTKEALSFAWEKLKGLLKHIFPTRVEGQISFGSEDPSVTGAVLAVLGTTMAFHKNCIEVLPVFDGENLFCGNVKLRGRVYGYMIVKTALQIYFNKNIKYVINRWKHKEETL